MDSDSLEEMLFGFPSSQASIDDAWDYDSQDEEMLDMPFDSQPTSWNLPDSPILTPALTEQDSDEFLMHDGKDANIHTHGPEDPAHIVRDRYSCVPVILNVP